MMRYSTAFAALPFAVLPLLLIVEMTAFAAEPRGLPVFVDDGDEFGRDLALRLGDSDEARRAPRVRLKASLEGLIAPASPGEFSQAWHQPPVCQHLTGNCWSYGATSFLESEIHRLSGRSLKLSETYTVYWEYVEKARRYVQQAGASLVPRGSQPNATLRMWKQYGIVPAGAYTGLPAERTIYSDRKMHAEIVAHLQGVATRGDWNEARAIAAVRAILDRHMGRPPERIEVDGESMTPREYLERVVRLNLEDYVCIVSFMQAPWYDWCEYPVPDNWWRSKAYFNVPLADFTRLVREVTEAGRTVCIGIDDGEPGFVPRQNVAFVPSFDLPCAAIDDGARQLRFTQQSTTDDHIVHIVGWQDLAGADAGADARERWYLIKDSGTHSRNGDHGGYMFYHQDYIRLKTLCLMLHRDLAERVLARSFQQTPGL